MLVCNLLHSAGRLRGKPMEEVEERNEDGGCHVIIVHVDFLFTVNHANDVEWI